MAEFSENFSGRTFLAFSKACWARAHARGVLIAANRTEGRVKRHQDTSRNGVSAALPNGAKQLLNHAAIG